METIIKEKIKQLDIQLNDRQAGQFARYYEILTEWNKVMNLTTITGFEETVDKHFVDSLSLVRALERHEIEKEDLSVIDIGTGAGFPGIPLKIAFPNLKITLLDSLNKRINFLNEVIGILKLENIKAMHGRAEDCARQNSYRERFDLCVSRAVANLATLTEYSLPYVRKEGYFISYKSGDIDKEVNLSKRAIRALGGSVEDIIKFNLPNTDIQRSMVKIKKLKNTDKKYPRKAGMPSREPL